MSKVDTIHHSNTDLIGNTPIIELQHPLISNGNKLWLKLESYNPNFSIKDRTALGLVQHGLQTGQLIKGGTLIESTSGNLGKSLAMLGAIYQFNVILVIDPKVPSNVRNWCKAYGAEVVIVEQKDTLGGYQANRIKKVQELLEQNPNAYWPNQYENSHNPLFHAATTADEIIQRQPDIIAGAISTGGHLCGIAQKVKQTLANSKILACDIAGSAIFQDEVKPYLLNGVGLAWRGRNIDLSVIDDICIFSDTEAISTCRIIAKECGVLLGGSGGGVVFSALCQLHNCHNQTLLAMIADSGSNYLDSIYCDQWLAQHGVQLDSSECLAKRISTDRIQHNSVYASCV